MTQQQQSRNLTSMIYPRSGGWGKGKNKIFHAISGPEGRAVGHGCARAWNLALMQSATLKITQEAL